MTSPPRVSITNPTVWFGRPRVPSEAQAQARKKHGGDLFPFVLNALANIPLPPSLEAVQHFGDAFKKRREGRRKAMAGGRHPQGGAYNGLSSVAIFSPPQITICLPSPIHPLIITQSSKTEIYFFLLNSQHLLSKSAHLHIISLGKQ